MPANHIIHLVTQAAAAFLRAQTFSFIADDDREAEIVTGINAAALGTVVLNCVHAVNAGPDRDGNWEATLSVELQQNCKDVDEDEHHEAAGELYAWFFTGTIHTDLEAALAGFGCDFVIAVDTGYRLEQEQGEGAPPGSWVSWMNFRVVCRGGTAG